jgi:hypothetical protein
MLFIDYIFITSQEERVKRLCNNDVLACYASVVVCRFKRLSYIK